MKNLFAIIVIGLLFSFSVYAQSSATIVKDLKTVANSVDETGYVYFGDWDRVDSISVSIAATGELDMDSLTVYKAVFDVINGKYYKDVSVLGNFTITLNLAAAGSDIEQLYSSNATLLTGAALRGCNAIYFVTRGATSGNDATDPNKAVLIFKIWGNRKT